MYALRLPSVKINISFHQSKQKWIHSSMGEKIPIYGDIIYIICSPTINFAMQKINEHATISKFSIILLKTSNRTFLIIVTEL